MGYFSINLVISFVLLLPFVFSAKILGLFPLNIKSHRLIIFPIVKGLAARGHNVTIISNFKSAHTLKNYTELLIKGNVTESMASSKEIFTMDGIVEKRGMNQFMLRTMAFELQNCEAILKHEYVFNILKSTEKIVDLIISEMHYSHCFNLLAVKLNVSIIYIKHTSSASGVDFMIGNINNPSYVPLMATSFTTKMNFQQRLSNFIYYLFHYLGFYTFMNEQNHLENIAKNYLNMELPSMEELHKKVALVLVNNHPSFITKVNGPNVVNVAGIHIEEPKPLPSYIKKFIDEAEQGAIFVSFGTNSIPNNTLNIFRNVFSKISQRVLWNINDFQVDIQLPNVQISNWFPQKDILEHRNVKLFINHCGLFGIYESIHTGTPVICIPLLFDHMQNANILKEKNMAIILDYLTITEMKLSSTILEMINNPRYSQCAEKLSIVFKDRLVSPLYESLYWIENVIRYPGSHLKTTIADMKIYEYILLDVLAINIGIFVVIVLICSRFMNK